MNIRCHGCSRQFRVRRDRLPAGGARTRCPRCDEVLVIPPQAAEPAGGPAPAPEAAAQPTDGEIFDLPPADLLPVDEDPVFTADEVEPAATMPAPEAAPAPEPEAWSPAPAEPEPPRRSGLRGWLSRLFGRDS